MVIYSSDPYLLSLYYNTLPRCRGAFPDSKTVPLFTLASTIPTLFSKNHCNLICILRSLGLRFSSKILCPHGVTPLGQARTKLNQSRPQICPPFRSCPSRFRDTAPAHSWPSPVSLGWSLSSPDGLLSSLSYCHIEGSSVESLGLHCSSVCPQASSP